MIWLISYIKIKTSGNRREYLRGLASTRVSFDIGHRRAINDIALPVGSSLRQQRVSMS
ncbi:hypothetical protein IE4872_PA00106 (plasmid) [Rhizobium gallicum]|uniref:Uncharacterized protein n=1 Tax=Rhizobium gallicum TaxID=56730 RepID=A0A1L5NPM5_9HYPH|nr:hypothetical protein IE4872_PA00106 [Rhizobium gallicum]